MWSDFISALKALDFQRLNQILVGIDVLTVLRNPWVIGVMLVCSVVFIIRGMEKALVTFLSVPAFLVLFQKTVQGHNALDFEADKLMIFVLGFVALAGLNVYFYFVRK